jgi:hypothetical protein
MAKNVDMISIPLNLAKLLAARDSDYKDPSRAVETREVALQLLRVLIEAQE